MFQSTRCFPCIALPLLASWRGQLRVEIWGWKWTRLRLLLLSGTSHVQGPTNHARNRPFLDLSERDLGPRTCPCSEESLRNTLPRSTPLNPALSTRARTEPGTGVPESHESIGPHTAWRWMAAYGLRIATRCPHRHPTLVCDLVQSVGTTRTPCHKSEGPCDQLTRLGARCWNSFIIPPG